MQRRTVLFGVVASAVAAVYDRRLYSGSMLNGICGGFGQTPAGQPVDIFTLTNANGVEVRMMNYGAIIVSFRVPDRAGKLDDIVLGYDTLESYTAGNPRFFGAVVGRYGNRIENGRFVLDGKTYQL